MTHRTFEAYALLNNSGVVHWVGFDGVDWYLVCSGSPVCSDCLRWETDRPLCAGCVSEAITEPMRTR